MPGLTCIDEGDESGLRHIHGLPGKEGVSGRNGVRAPVQLNAKSNAGISTAVSSGGKAALPRGQLLGSPSGARSTRSYLELPLSCYNSAIFRVPVRKARSNAESVFEEVSA